MKGIVLLFVMLLLFVVPVGAYEPVGYVSTGYAVSYNSNGSAVSGYGSNGSSITVYESYGSAGSSAYSARRDAIAQRVEQRVARRANRRAVFVRVLTAPMRLVARAFGC